VEQLTADFGGSGVTGVGVGPVLEKFDGVSRIAVLRGGGLGDLLFAIPAIASLKAAYQGATITLLGTPVHEHVISATESPVDNVRVLPVSEGVRPGEEDPAELDRFFAEMRAERFDLAVQLHGGGRYSNPFLLRLGARHTVGTRTSDAASLERTVPYLYYQHEPLRALEVAGFAGAPPTDLEARLLPRRHLAGEQHDVMSELLQSDAQALVVIHPGATDPRRRWPADRFAEVAAGCAADGSQVLIVGDPSERQLADDVAGRALARSTNAPAAGRSGTPPGRPGSGPIRSGLIRSVAGELDMAGLVALLARADVMVGNDSGPRHLAQALGTPTVGVFWVGNVINAGALGRSLHRIHASWVTRCQSCGVDVTQVGWTAPRCGHDQSLVAEVAATAVYEDVRNLTATSPLLRGR
jgi:ADP-heptose:LPS heptosyltransferase